MNSVLNESSAFFTIVGLRIDSITIRKNIKKKKNPDYYYNYEITLLGKLVSKII